MRKNLIILVVAMMAIGGGTATAAKLITGDDVKNGSLTGKDIENGSIKKRDLAKSLRGVVGTSQSQSPGAPGAQGGQGPKGDAGTNGSNGQNGAPGQDGAVGPQGPQGEPGDPAAVGISHWSEGAKVPAMSQHGLPGSIQVTANCQQEGHIAIAGGYTAGTYKGGVTTYLNRNTTGAPGTDAYGAGWIVGFTNTTDKEQDVRAWVVCASVTEDEPTG